MDRSRLAEWLRANPEHDPRSPDAVNAADARRVHASQAVSTFVDEEDLAQVCAEPTPGPPATASMSSAALVPKGLVGTGAMALVHAADEPRLRRVVAYKVMKPELARSPQAVRRFRTEAQITAQLDHPNIVPVYAYAADATGAPAYSMKLVAGHTLEDLLTLSASARRSGKAPRELRLPALLDQFLKVCDAVHFAHSRGVIHRDLKPANVMLGEHREVYVMDWGLAKVVAEADTRPEDTIGTDHGLASATRAGAVLGTPAYMAPEQAEAGLVGPSADQYALGLILYEVVCGRRGRPGHAIAEVLEAAQGGTLDPFTPAGPGEPLPRELVAIAQKATGRQPRDRYASVGELAEDVRHYLANEPVRAQPDGWLQAIQRALSRRREDTFRLLVGLGALLALVITGALAKHQHDERLARERGDALAARVSDAARIASAMDEHLSTVADRVSAIATAARNLLVHGAPSAVPYYRNRAFFDPATRPLDMAQSAKWGKELSTAWPNVHVALDDWGQAEGALARLAPIRREMRDALLAPPLADGPPDAAWLADGGPVTYVDVGLANGAVLELPGAGWEPGAYDPRSRPWYQNGATSDHATWGLPFPAFAGGALLLPCSMAIRDDAGALLGVVSVQISLDSVVGRALLPTGTAARETFLVDDAGRMIVRSSELDLRARATQLDEVHDTPPFPHDELRPAFVNPSGYLELPDALLTWQRLHSAPWSIVVDAAPL